MILVACDGLITSTTGISIEEPNKTVYNLGESFDSTSFRVYAYMSNGEVKELTSEDYTLTNTDLNRLGEHTIRVKYHSKEAEFTVYVKKANDSIKMVYITDYPLTVFYDTVRTSATINLEGLSLTYLTANFDTNDASLSDFSVVIVNADYTDSEYTVYAVNLSHKSLEGISTTFLIYVS